MSDRDIRALAYELVYDVMEKGGKSDVLYHMIADREELAADSAALLKREAFGTIEYAVRLDAMIRRFADRPVRNMTPDVRTMLRLGFYELEYMVL